VTFTYPGKSGLVGCRVTTAWTWRAQGGPASGGLRGDVVLSVWWSLGDWNHVSSPGTAWGYTRRPPCCNVRRVPGDGRGGLVMIGATRGLGPAGAGVGWQPSHGWSITGRLTRVLGPWSCSSTRGPACARTSSSTPASRRDPGPWRGENLGLARARYPRARFRTVGP